MAYRQIMLQQAQSAGRTPLSDNLNARLQGALMGMGM
jgi:hypothetical protein